MIHGLAYGVCWAQSYRAMTHHAHHRRSIQWQINGVPGIIMYGQYRPVLQVQKVKKMWAALLLLVRTMHEVQRCMRFIKRVCMRFIKTVCMCFIKMHVLHKNAGKGRNPSHSDLSISNGFALESFVQMVNDQPWMAACQPEQPSMFHKITWQWLA